MTDSSFKDESDICTGEFHLTSDQFALFSRKKNTERLRFNLPGFEVNAFANYFHGINHSLLDVYINFTKRSEKIELRLFKMIYWKSIRFSDCNQFGTVHRL